MSDGENNQASENGEEGPGAAYEQFQNMELLLDKLKLLNYEESFCKELGFKAVTKHFFAIPTNPGEQFYSFTSLAAWLLQKSGKKFDQPQEYDDPNASISAILDEIRSFEEKPDFPPSKLKSGCGAPVIWVLNIIADEALKKKSFVWKMPRYPDEDAEEETIINDDDDDAEIDINKADDDIIEEEDFDDEENIMGLDDLKNLKNITQGDMVSSKPDHILESNTDASNWKLEVERVLPQLKVAVRMDNKDWRVHVEQMHLNRDKIDNSLKNTRSQLDRLYDDISRTLEKIQSREKYINNHLEGPLQEFRVRQDQLSETKEKYRQASGGVTERSQKLADITDELERIKQNMEQRGTSMTDGTPVVRIRKSISKLRQEMTQMDIRVGVLQHVLLQEKLKERFTQNIYDK